MFFFFILFVVLWVILLFKRGLFHFSLWQVKEYRLYRLKDHFSTEEGRKLLFHPLFVCRIMLFVLGFLLLYLRTPIYIFHMFFIGVGLLYGYEVGKFVKLVVTKLFKRPKPTKKILLMLLITVSIYVFSLWKVIHDLGGFHQFHSGLMFPVILFMFDFFLPIIIALVVFIFWPITLIAKKYYLFKAEKYLKKWKHLRIIGITGSYGKSSTKEFLYTVLSESFRVFKAQGNINTEIGLAKVILRTDFSKYDVFIVEMGAYRIGEIQLICDMVHPQMGILTGINEQHLSLFGSIENTMKAKYELIASLPKDGHAFMNVYNERVRSLAEGTNHTQVVLYSTHDANADISASNVKVQAESVSFDVHVSGKKQLSLNVSVIGGYNVENLLAVFAVAHALHMKVSEIEKGFSQILAVNRTMQPIKGEKNRIYIDDTYNANPDGVIAALEYLKTFHKKKKVVVISQLIELGKHAKEVHEHIAEKMGNIADIVIVMNKTYRKEMIRGFKKAGGKENAIFFEKSVKKIINILDEYAAKDTVILFEGRGPENILTQCK